MEAESALCSAERFVEVSLPCLQEEIERANRRSAAAVGATLNLLCIVLNIDWCLETEYTPALADLVHSEFVVILRPGFFFDE